MFGMILRSVAYVEKAIAGDNYPIAMFVLRKSIPKSYDWELIMKNRIIVCGLVILLFLFPAFQIAMGESSLNTIDANTPVYFNPDGGMYYHLDPNCISVAEEWRNKFEEFTYDNLFKKHWYRLPCTACVDISSQFLWEGEKELREAVPSLQQAMTELGISHLQPYAWRITPEKDELAVIFIEGKVYEFLLVLSDGEWLLKEE